MIPVLRAPRAVAPDRLDMRRCIGRIEHVLISWRNGELLEPRQQARVADRFSARGEVLETMAIAAPTDRQFAHLDAAQRRARRRRVKLLLQFSGCVVIPTVATMHVGQAALMMEIFPSFSRIAARTSPILLHPECRMASKSSALVIFSLCMTGPTMAPLRTRISWHPFKHARGLAASPACVVEGLHDGKERGSGNKGAQHRLVATDQPVL